MNMNQNELRAISQLVADLNADVHNQVKMLHDRLTVAEQRVESWEQWGGQVNEAIDELAGRIASLQQWTVENIADQGYESAVTDHYRRFVAMEAARVGVELKELQGEIKRARLAEARKTMDPMVDVDDDS